MSLLIKGMDMPAKGEYDLTLFCHSDGTASLVGFFTEFEGEPFEVIEVRTIPFPGDWGIGTNDLINRMEENKE